MNMKLSRVRRIWILALVVFLAPVATLAGDEAKPDAKPEAAPEEKGRLAQLLAKPEVLFGNDFDIRGLKGPERRAIGVYRYEREVRQLLEIMLSELELTDLQKNAIGELVEEQIAYAHFKGGSPRTFSGRQRNALAEPGSPTGPIVPPTGRADPTRAKQKWDIDDIRERNRPSGSMFDDPMAFVNLLATELSGQQIEQFKELANRWKVLRPFGSADGPLRQLSRAVRDPALEIGEVHRESADKRVRQEILTLGRDRQHADKRIAAYEKAKADIVANLAPAQREHLENTLKELQTEFADEVLLIMDMRAANKGKEEAKNKGKDVKGKKKPTD